MTRPTGDDGELHVNYFNQRYHGTYVDDYAGEDYFIQPEYSSKQKKKRSAIERRFRIPIGKIAVTLGLVFGGYLGLRVIQTVTDPNFLCQTPEQIRAWDEQQIKDCEGSELPGCLAPLILDRSMRVAFPDNTRVCLKPHEVLLGWNDTGSEPIIVTVAPPPRE